MEWIIAAVLLVTALVVLAFVPFNIEFQARIHGAEHEKLVVDVSMLGGKIQREWRFSFANVPGALFGIWLTDKKDRRFLIVFHVKPQKLRIAPKRSRLMTHLYRHIQVQVLDLQAEVGIRSDAAATALVTGAVQAAVYALTTAFYPPKGITKKRILIQPRFNRACFNFKSKCIITIRLEHIINAGWNNLFNKRKKAV